MVRCLVVGNQTLNSTELAAVMAERMAQDEHTFYVVVPATPLQQQVTGIAGVGQDENAEHDRAYAVARQRLEEVLDALRYLEADVDGEVGDPDALEAVRTAMGRFDAQEVIVSTLPLGLSRWLKRDLPSRIERTFRVPVTQVVSEVADHT